MKSGVTNECARGSRERYAIGRDSPNDTLISGLIRPPKHWRKRHSPQLPSAALPACATAPPERAWAPPLCRLHPAAAPG
eukprot:scaffold57_cov254-Pinguiococcus_pyrenoidosus.AAC.9